MRETQIDLVSLEVSAARPSAATWAALAAAARACTACPELAASRTTVVVGDAPPGARLALVGEAPGAEEDPTGRPFVGKAGALLDELLAEAGLDRAGVAVVNVLKCRPPGNRTPAATEATRCRAGWSASWSWSHPSWSSRSACPRPPPSWAAASGWRGARRGARGGRPPDAADLPPVGGAALRPARRPAGGAARRPAHGGRAAHFTLLNCSVSSTDLQPRSTSDSLSFDWQLTCSSLRPRKTK